VEVEPLVPPELTPAAFAIARPVQCVVSPGGSASVIMTTRPITTAGTL
jgi:hypothetical protein